MNTRTKKYTHANLLDDHPADIMDQYFFYTIPEAMENCKAIHILQKESNNHGIGYVEPQLLRDHKSIRNLKKMKRGLDTEVELLAKLWRELQFAYRFSTMDDGKVGI